MISWFRTFFLGTETHRKMAKRPRNVILSDRTIYLCEAGALIQFFSFPFNRNGDLSNKVKPVQIQVNYVKMNFLRWTTKYLNNMKQQLKWRNKIMELMIMSSGIVTKCGKHSLDYPLSKYIDIENVSSVRFANVGNSWHSPLLLLL